MNLYKQGRATSPQYIQLPLNCMHIIIVNHELSWFWRRASESRLKLSQKNIINQQLYRSSSGSKEIDIATLKLLVKLKIVYIFCKESYSRIHSYSRINPYSRIYPYSRIHPYSRIYPYSGVRMNPGVIKNPGVRKNRSEDESWVKDKSFILFLFLFPYFHFYA